MVPEELLLEVLHDQFHLEVRGGDQLDGPASVVALNLGLAGGCFSRPWRKGTSSSRFWPAYWQSIASTSPMSMPPMPKSTSSTDPHGHCEAQKVVGIGGSLVAARIRLSSPYERARTNISGGCGSRELHDAVEYGGNNPHAPEHGHGV